MIMGSSGNPGAWRLPGFLSRRLFLGRAGARGGETAAGLARETRRPGRPDAPHAEHPGRDRVEVAARAGQQR